MSTQTSQLHPAPHRDKVSMFLLLLGLMAAPLMWAGHLYLSYAFAAESCFPGDAPLKYAVEGAAAVRTILAVFDAVALTVAVVAGLIAFRSWRTTRHEAEQADQHAVEVGEGRTRFMAVWGMLSSGLFFGALLFATIASLAVPICQP
jgi:hypothetical protein